MSIPNMVHLYVNVSRVGLDINLNSEPFGQLEDRAQVIVPDTELVASLVYNDEEMVANNEYMDFRTETNDDFEEFDFDGLEHELPSNTLTQIDMDVIDSIREHDPIVVPVVVDNSELYKGMICQDKETLQHMMRSLQIPGGCFCNILKKLYSMMRYTLDKILKWAARSSKHEVQSYDQHEGVFHVKTGRHSLNAKGGNIQILRLNASE
ncbi:uncharacterized protein E5676_scaffold523G00110 [Cucumis melo var. makuwa]|uniref:Uncharacterized protein n=1 Tax=Cucumis melo var. makuwa TaxID=1194695 RepID=A0A5A7VAN3_CUCMM|nr:uncharacterized protein E6C27_scaffold382G00620 [Cucumis melo var. makuwa]TYK22529.1 uncharacterized protein E5676_scaffold523G00110 [Cucumis melo var. makuwa]